MLIMCLLGLNVLYDGYIVGFGQNEKPELVENFDRFNKLKHSITRPRTFTEKGLYMLDTILKSKKTIVN